MKTTILLLISVFAVFGVQAQSKKKLNEQYLAELSTVVKTSDSLEKIRGDKEKYIKYFYDHFDVLEKRILNQKKLETQCRYDIRRYHSELVKLGVNADSTVAFNDLKAQLALDQKENILETKIPENQEYDFALVSALQDLTGVKIKAQNAILKLKIAEFEKANDLNKAVLSNQQIRIDELRAIQTTFEVFIECYDAFNRQLSQKSNRNYLEAKFKKEEQERLKQQKALEAANKKKSKKPKNGTLPPLIEQDPVYPDEERIVEGEKEGDPFFYYTPIPEAPPKQAPEILETLDQYAEFPGGMQALKNYLAANLKYPQTALEMGVQGKCYLRFVVSETGSISNVQVMRGVPDCQECDAEAVRVIKNMPDWTPGKNMGEPVNSWYNIPITFKLEK